MDETSGTVADTDAQPQDALTDEPLQEQVQDAAPEAEELTNERRVAYARGLVVDALAILGDALPKKRAPLENALKELDRVE